MLSLDNIYVFEENEKIQKLGTFYLFLTHKNIEMWDKIFSCDKIYGKVGRFFTLTFQKVRNLGRFDFDILKICEIWDILKRPERKGRKMGQKDIVTNNAKTVFCFTIVF